MKAQNEQHFFFIYDVNIKLFQLSGVLAINETNPNIKKAMAQWILKNEISKSLPNTNIFFFL